MTKTVKKAFNYVGYVKAILTGDTAEATAIKNKNLTRSILQMQISAKNHEITRAHNDKDRLQEAETIAFVNNGKYIEDENEWIRATLEAGNAIIAHEAKIDKLEKTLDKLKELLTRVED